MNVLDADPDTAERVRSMRDFAPDLVPVAEGGNLAAFVHGEGLARISLPTPLPAADYVTGLELLGFRFEMGNDGSGLYQLDPVSMPDAWHRRAHALMAALGTGRSDEIIDYLAERASADRPEPVT